MTGKRKNLAVRRTAQILKSFTKNTNGWGVSDLASHLGLAKSVVFENLNVLVEEGLIKKDEEKKEYFIGDELLRLSLTHLGNIEIIKVSRPILKDLAKELGETVLLSKIINNRTIIIEKVDGSYPLRFAIDIGAELPLYKGSSAKVYLAFLPDKKREELIKIHQINMNRLKKEIEIVRKRGYAISKEEVFTGVYALTVPIFNNSDEIIAAIGVGGPSLRFKKETIVAKILDAAKKVSFQMGYLNWRWGSVD
jgi:DNA-binding IclR family transcriptional regulator